MEYAAAAAAPSSDILRPAPAYCRTFAADTDSIFIIKELRGFLTIENYNGLTLQLSRPAYERAQAYLERASTRITLLNPEFTPDGEGGIDIEWERNGRHLALSVSGLGEDGFISWREPHGRYEGERATEELLVEKLDWLSR